MNARVRAALELGLPGMAGAWLLWRLCTPWAGRLAYPFDLEWMEGGMLAHAWRLENGLPLYVRPGLDFAPYLYPPGYPSLLAALGRVVPLSMPLGRSLSLLGITLAALAVAFIVRRQGGGRGLAFGTAMVFLGTYDAAGAFYDLVRPDSVGVALMAWSVALGLEERRGAPIASGLLLAAAFLCKQNLAVVGLPLLTTIAVRDGWRAALGFLLASAGPALTLVAYWQWRSGGEFLTWMVRVAMSHPAGFDRAWRLTPREIGTPLPVAVAVLGSWAVWRASERRPGLPRWLTVGVPVWCGMLLGWLGTYLPPEPNSGMYNVPAGFAYWAFAAIPVAALLWRPRSWRVGAGLGVGAVTLAMAAWMRAHNGGFLNVHMPALWCVSTGMGVVLARWRAPAVAAGVVTLQLVWLSGLYDRHKLVPSAEDEALGWRIVEALRGVEGPVLSPFAAWLPVYAGHPPSLHYMGVWDSDYPDGPYRDDLVVYRQALAEHHWAVIVGGNQRFLDGLVEYYEPAEELVGQNASTLMPRTGWRARPWRLMVPK